MSLSKSVLAGLLLASSLFAPGPLPAADPKPAPRTADQLTTQQGAIADKYAKLERLLEEMARIESVSNPKRASLLTQALKQSKENLTATKLNAIIKLLSQEQFKRAMENQQDARKDMQALLELLLSENRSDRLKTEQERVKEYLKEVERIIRLEKSLQGRTEGGAATQEVAKDQDRVADRTGQLAKKIQDNEEGGSGKKQDGAGGDDKKSDGKPQDQPAGEGQGKDGKPGDGKPGEGKPGEGKPGAGKPGEGKPGEGKPGEGKPGEGKPGEGKPGEGKPGEGKPGAGKPNAGKPSDKPAEGKPSEGKPGQGKPGEGKPGEGKPGEGKPGDGKPGDSKKSSKGQGKPQDGQGQSQGEGDDQDDQQKQKDQKDQAANPARKRIQAAEQKMREAKQKLEEAKRKEAVKEQEAAQEELAKAKAELEKILRQLREEEVERVLALLEARFRKMLEIQLRIYEDTVRLDKVPKEERELKVNVPAGRLAVDERKLVVEADKALNLLMEEGSSIAFPETVGQMRDDMQQVSDRLDAANVSRITQNIEEDIIAALEEMIAALQKAQKDKDKQKQQGQPPPPGQPQDQPLVDTISELKMIRNLQMRVNTRTQRYARLLDNVDDPTGQATDQDLRKALGTLAEKQERIYKITRDLVLGKNK